MSGKTAAISGTTVAPIPIATSCYGMVTGLPSTGFTDYVDEIPQQQRA